jgi:purine-binding chemotaxis protein CheW
MSGLRLAGREPARWDALARRAAAPAADPGGTDPDLRELLVAWMDQDPYGLPVERVREIVRMRPITPIPRMPPAVRGVISLRGEVVQVIDLRVRLGVAAESSAPARRRRIVVLHGEDGQLGALLVDRVSEVLRMPGDRLRPPAGREADAVVALAPFADRFVSIFDVDRLFDLGRRPERTVAP